MKLKREIQWVRLTAFSPDSGKSVTTTVYDTTPAAVIALIRPPKQPRVRLLARARGHRSKSVTLYGTTPDAAMKDLRRRVGGHA